MGGFDRKGNITAGTGGRVDLPVGKIPQGRRPWQK